MTTFFGEARPFQSVAERSRADAVRRKAEAEGKMDELKAAAAAKKREYEKLKHQLERDSVAAEIDELETKMRHFEQTIYVLTEHIETKGAESNFEVIAEECLQMIGNINNESIQALKERPIFSQAAAY